VSSHVTPRSTGLVFALAFSICLFVFGASTATAAPPVVTIDPPGATTYTTAQVSGTVDPGAAETYYSFEYSKDPVTEGWSEFTFAGPIAAGAGVTSVATELTGLEPGTTYEVRLAAENFEEFVEVFSPEPNPTFTTTIPTAPTVESTFSSEVSFDQAGLGARINPDGADTKYFFEYGTDPSYGAQSPAAPVDIGSGGQPRAAATTVTGLQPQTTYHFRVVATNAVNTTFGPDRTFTTSAAGVGPTGLPDGRAYEQVTPVEKGGQDGVFFDGTSQATLLSPQVSATGEQASYFSFGSFSGANVANPFYLATRGGAEWSSQAIIPPQSTVGAVFTLCAPQYSAYSPDLARGVLEDGFNPFGGCGADSPPLVPGEPRGVQNLFLRDNVAGTYQLINVTPAGVTPSGAAFQGASPDLRHVVFDEAAPLTPDATAGDMLYEWSAGAVSLVGAIPVGPATTCSGSECVAAEGAKLGGANFSEVAQVDGAVSADGARIFFNANGNLYLREGATTTQVDVSQGPGPSGGGKYMTATPGGSVLFTDPNQLTGNASPAGEDLYRYDAATGQLTDLTPDAADPGGAAVQGLVGASEDGSRVYFVANGVLTTTPSSQGVTATEGGCIKTFGADEAHCNLYLWQGGTTTFIGALIGTDREVWDGASRSRVSADGSVLAFGSIESLTGYDNADLASGEPDSEVFLYDAGTNGLACVSCRPSGARPIGRSAISASKFRPRNSEPGGGPSSNTFSLQRNLTAGGRRLFFDSNDALVPADTNRRQDVYEFEAQGTGSCAGATAPGTGGCVYLISSGRDESGSYFYDAGSNGDNVFFLTRSQLVGQDTDTLQDLYDARVGGGLAGQNPAPAAAPCAGESCRGSAGEAKAPPVAPVGSSSGAGGGNVNGTCASAARRHRLLGQAKQLRRRAKHAADGKAAAKLKKQAARLAKAAKQSPKSCKRGNQGGSK
jgi:hypothetical protein